MAAMCAAILQGVGAVIVSEESLLEGTDALAASIAQQPVWSDLPVLVLSKSGAESQRLAANLAKLGNVGVVERPVRISTLLSLVQSALRARERQYQVRSHVSDMDKARAEAERVSRIKDEFLATLSHELRTPLNAIVGWSQIIRSSPQQTEDVAEGIEVIERNARAQTKIIEDLLDMSRIISGKLRLDVQRIDLADA
ncbi:MAG: hybrid sensor histidine kinase/response regulator, partial [Phycisphaerae bacterium]|nr:hybrid sensor histidine kinase/response regulator [Phycisphaerae bacterium]